MPNRSVTLVRHGHREDFVGDSWSPIWSQTAQNPHDPDISERGEREATALGLRLASLSPLTVLASPFLRTVHTASLIGQALGQSVHVENGLHEWMHPQAFPSFPTLRSLEQLQSRFGNVRTDYQPVTEKSFPEPSLGAVVARAGQALESILDRHSGDLVLVTHADPLLGFLMAAGIDACRQPVQTCGVYRIEGGPGGWELTIDGEKVESEN
jgi:broad specificity phosphatase PhoE